MNRFVGRAWPVVLGLAVGAIAGAGVIFCLHWRWKLDLISELSAVTPTTSLPESVQNGPETAPTAVPEKAETTTGTVVQSAREAEDPERSEADARGGHPGPERGVAAGRDDLLELLTSESQTAAARLGAENARLRKENAEQADRIGRLGKRLAEAMEALDAHAASGMPPPATETAGDVPVDGQVLDVNPELGLAVVDQGSRHGVRYGLPLTVLRGRRKVAKVRVVDVREALSGAVIEEMAGEDGPKPGDRAVLAGTAGSGGK